MSSENLGFEVDTQLFRELGELLVGRDSTALAELVKNAYDADATHVNVYGQNLDDLENGVIIITDDGHGMNYQDFIDGFLKIASRRKSEDHNRVSPIFGRRVTGEKGIGRLAAHKLASVLEIESFPHPTKGTQGIKARIDWNEIEKLGTFNEIQGSGAVTVESIPVKGNHHCGTSIKLTRIRKTWSQTSIKTFSNEMVTYRLPRELLLDPKQEIKAHSIIGMLSLGAHANGSGQFSISLQGEFADGDEISGSLLNQAEWLLEVRSEKDQVIFNICQIPEKTDHNLVPYTKQFPVPSERYGSIPKFEARIYYRERSWTHNRGIGTYVEGFRVFPYGEFGNDWLSIESQYAERSRSLNLPSIFGEQKPDDGLMRASSRSYFGGVFLNAESHPGLKMLINREGFVANDAFDALVSALKNGLDLLVRARSEAKEAKSKAAKARDIIPDRPTSMQRAEKSIENASVAAEETRKRILEGDTKGALKTLDKAVSQLQTTLKTTDDLMSEHRLVNVLAGIGTHLSGFTHDIQQMVAEISILESILKEILELNSFQANHRSKLNKAIGKLGEVKQLVEYQGLFLADLVTVDARRRRAKQLLKERFDAAFRFVSGAADRAMIQVQNEIASNLETPPMFRSELSIVLANLLSNAVKASGEGGRIWAHGKDNGREVLFILENTGQVVPLNDADRFFDPFVSTSDNADPKLGRGMGLGLTIVRSILDNSKATIKFVSPSDGFSTAIQIAWKR